MRGSEFLDKMGLISPVYVEAAEIVRKQTKSIWITWGAAAAGFALVILAGTRVLLPMQPGQNTDLPILSVSEFQGGMGFEGYMAYDISELVNANPWSESVEVSTLPVYRNVLTYDTNYTASGADWGKMRELLLETAGRLGLDAETLTITDNAPDEAKRQRILEKHEAVGSPVPEGAFDPTMLMINTGEIEITVDSSLTVKVEFEPAVDLPEGYDFTTFASYEDCSAVADYLKAEYRDFIGMENPQGNIHGGDYTYFGAQGYGIEFFDASGTMVEQIINYNFYPVAFYGDSDGKLFLARIFQTDLSDKVGDYPILSSEQARELLLDGNGLTTVPYEFPGEEYIRKAELVYRTGMYEEYYMPYYRFYVEIPEAGMPEEGRELGLKTYGAYYVPAVESSYISNMPVWDGRFN